MVKRLSGALKDDKSAIILRTITQEEVDKMLDGAEFTLSSINNSVFNDAKMRAAKVNLATIGDCSFVDCDLFVVDFSEAYLNNRSIKLLRKARIFNLENLDR